MRTLKRGNKENKYTSEIRMFILPNSNFKVAIQFTVFSSYNLLSIRPYSKAGPLPPRLFVVSPPQMLFSYACVVC